MHCFAEDWDTARAALDIGFYISFSGIVTFNSAKERGIYDKVLLFTGKRVRHYALSNPVKTIANA